MTVNVLRHEFPLVSIGDLLRPLLDLYRSFNSPKNSRLSGVSGVSFLRYLLGPFMNLLHSGQLRQVSLQRLNALLLLSVLLTLPLTLLLQAADVAIPRLHLWVAQSCQLSVGCSSTLVTSVRFPPSPPVFSCLQCIFG